MRCILVSDTSLKADARCTCCRKKIGDSYVREISTRFIYCDYDCFQSAEAASVRAHKLPVNTWTVNS
jgi:hypothetical protein